MACISRRGHGRWPVFPKLFSVIPTNARNISTTFTTNTFSRGLILITLDANLIFSIYFIIFYYWWLKGIDNRSNRYSTTTSLMADSSLGLWVYLRRSSSMRSCFSSLVIFVFRFKRFISLIMWFNRSIEVKIQIRKDISNKNQGFLNLLIKAKNMKFEETRKCLKDSKNATCDSNIVIEVWFYYDLLFNK